MLEATCPGIASSSLLPLHYVLLFAMFWLFWAILILILAPMCSHLHLSLLIWLGLLYGTALDFLIDLHAAVVCSLFRYNYCSAYFPWQCIKRFCKVYYYYVQICILFYRFLLDLLETDHPGVSVISEATLCLWAEVEKCIFITSVGDEAGYYFSCYRQYM